MAVTGLDHYNLRASRETLDVLKDFYCDVVGLKNGPRPPFATFGYWLYAGERAVLHLSEARTGEIRTSHLVNTFDHVAFNCVDLAATQSALAQHGIAVSQAEVPGTGQVQLFLRDPAGNGVELNFAPVDR
ncbi:MAG: VOC family protein [Betaproteobacteria bacterium]|nr:VOC family protein [Betaproteobacteria bacterium]